LLNCILFWDEGNTDNVRKAMSELRANPDSGFSADLAYKSIREQILSGELKGGQWLREGDLASLIGVSRTPVREALNRLAAEGLVQHERNRGVQVQSWTRQDLDEVFGLRSLLEPWGCALAATRGETDLELLDVLVTKMDEAANHEHPDVLVMTELNNQFHHAILTASGNNLLISIVSSVQEIPLRRRTYSHFTPDERRRSLAHHHELATAMRTGDAEWAESVMRAHLRAAWNTAQRDN
jgi:DNA-binding GntR family transcriptional regulator